MSNSHSVRPQRKPTRLWVQILAIILACIALAWVPAAIIISVVGLFSSTRLAAIGAIMFGIAGVIIALGGLIANSTRNKRSVLK